MSFNKLIKFDTLKKIEIILNTKRAAKKWSQKENQLLDVDTNNNNVALLTGKDNNIIVIDLDVKDDGINEFEKYCKIKNIKTVLAKTPSGGYHIYFQYKNSNKLDQFLIDNYLLNKSKYRGKGIDVRSNGGYIMAAPSSIDGKKYEWINSFEKTKVQEIPSDLLQFLLIENINKKTTIKQTKRKNIVNDVIYNISMRWLINDEQIKKLLNDLSTDYVNDYNKWLIITSILKNMNKYDIWNNWSKKSNKFDENNNIDIWNNNRGIIDINYLCYLLDKPLIEKYKHYEAITQEIICDKITINDKYLNNELKFETFEKYETLIIQSTTGTGKTTITSEIVDKLLKEDKNLKFISLVARKTLAMQHIKNFNNIDIKHYEDKEISKISNNIVVCINSILLISSLTDFQLSNYIVYIDEINSFIESLTHNETLNGKLKNVYRMLIRLIKCCKKIIVSDAMISDNVFTFFNKRDDKTKVFINNEYKKYTDLKATKYNDENNFLIKLQNNIKNNKFFLFGCDSATIVEKYYNTCIYNLKKEDKEKFILITAENKFKITDANEQFKNKFVFYSPSITYGVDFNYDLKTDVFIYIKGDSLLSSGIFQQTTRCRNIDELYFYSKGKKRIINYEKLGDVNDIYKNLIMLNNQLNEVSLSIDINDNDIIVENSFFDLFCYNEYVIDIYKNNITAHYELILKKNGFNVINYNDNKKQLKKDVNDMMKSINEEIKDELFKEYLHTNEFDRIKTEKYEIINDRIKLLNIINENNILIEYQTLLTKKDAIDNHFNLMRFFKDDEYIKEKNNDNSFLNYEIKNIDTKTNQINILRKITKKLNINEYDVSYFDDVKINMTNDDYDLIKGSFKTTMKKPTTKQEFKKFHVMMIKNICGDDILISNKLKSGENRDKMNYNLNINLINMMFKIDTFNNPNRKNYKIEILDKYNIKYDINKINNDKNKNLFI